MAATGFGELRSGSPIVTRTKRLIAVFGLKTTQCTTNRHVHPRRPLLFFDRGGGNGFRRRAAGRVVRKTTPGNGTCPRACFARRRGGAAAARVEVRSRAAIGRSRGPSGFRSSPVRYYNTPPGGRDVRSVKLVSRNKSGAETASTTDGGDRNGRGKKIAANERAP